MEYNKLNITAIKKLSDSDLLVLGHVNGVLRLNGFEVCFRGMRHPYLDHYPIILSKDFRKSIISSLEELISKKKIGL